MVRLEDLFKQTTGEDFNPEKRKKVGGYVLGKILGEGSFAKVRLGVHILTREKVAIKIINKKVIQKRDYVRKNMRREAALLQRLDHPNIVRLYEILETENSFYMVVELVHGGDMMTYLNERNGVSENEARRFMRQIVSAVDHVHRSGVVHRDLKVENLLVDKDKNVKIIDFGLSNFFDGENLLSTQCGSPAYAAPEIFNKRQYGPGADVWSIGVNLYAMVTGNLPFTVNPPNNLSKLHAAILKGCQLPGYLSLGCQDLIRKMLEVHEKHRISMAEVIDHPWLNEEYVPLEPWGLKTKLPEEEVNHEILNYISSHCADTHVQEDIRHHRPSAATATYNLLEQRIEKGLGFPSPAEVPGSDQPGQLDTARTVMSSRLDRCDTEHRFDSSADERNNPDKENTCPQVNGMSIMESDSIPPQTAYRGYLRQLKLEKNILQKRPVVTTTENDAIDKVAAVNKSNDKEGTTDNRASALKKLGVTIKSNPDEVEKRTRSSKSASNEIRPLSNRFLQKYAVNDPSNGYRPVREKSIRRDLGHRLRVSEIMEKYGDGKMLPSAPPNSAHIKKHRDSLPRLASVDAEVSHETASPQDTNDKHGKGMVLNHKCAPRKHPVVYTASPDTPTNKFYDKYRFKVRNSDGERMHTWDSKDSELPSMVAHSGKSRTSSNYKMRTGQPYGPKVASQQCKGDKIEFNEFGLSYRIPEHNTSIPKSRQRPSYDVPSLGSRQSTSIKINGRSSGPTIRRPAFVNPRDLIYSDLKSGKVRKFSLVVKPTISNEVT